MLPVLKGRGASLFPEFPQEIAQIIIAAFEADFRDRQVSFFQQLACLFDPVFVDIFHWGTSDRFFEEAAEILFV